MGVRCCGVSIFECVYVLHPLATARNNTKRNNKHEGRTWRNSLSRPASLKRIVKGLTDDFLSSCPEYSSSNASASASLKWTSSSVATRRGEGWMLFLLSLFPLELCVLFGLDSSAAASILPSSPFCNTFPFPFRLDTFLFAFCSSEAWFYSFGFACPYASASCLTSPSQQLSPAPPHPSF